MAEGNKAMQENWETASGAKWVRVADEMDRRLERIGALLLERAAAQPGERVLDVGCGGGATTRLLADAVTPGGSVVGLDISEAMLGVARARLEGRPEAALVRGDAEDHAFAPPPFDLVASRFGVMFFADPVRAFRNIRGAMRAGARLCFVCWAPLAENPSWRIPFEIAVRHLGPPATKPPHAPGPMAFDDPDYVRGLLGAAGFRGVVVKREATEVPGRASAAKEAEFAVLMGPAAAHIGEVGASEDAVAAIREEVEAAIAPRATPAGIVTPATVFVVTATA